MEFAGTQIPDDPARRCWAIQGTGSHGRRADRIAAHPWSAGPPHHPSHDPPRLKRCLKRSIARQLFKLLERSAQPGLEIIRAA